MTKRLLVFTAIIISGIGRNSQLIEILVNNREKLDKCFKYI